MKTTKLILAVLLSLGMAQGVFADSASSSNSDNIEATVQGICRVDSFSLDFGAYDGLVAHATTPLDGTASIKVYCTKGTVGSVILSSGQNLVGSSRQMKSAAGDFLIYELYADSGRSQIWDASNGQGATASSKNVPLSGTDGFTAFGRVFSDQDIPAGSYVDTIQATVNF